MKTLRLQTSGALVRATLDLSFDRIGSELHTHAQLEVRIPIKGKSHYELKSVDRIVDSSFVLVSSQLISDDGSVRDERPLSDEELAAGAAMSSQAMLYRVLEGSREPGKIIFNARIYALRLEPSSQGYKVWLRKPAGSDERNICELLLRGQEFVGASFSVPLVGAVKLHKVDGW